MKKLLICLILSFFLSSVSHAQQHETKAEQEAYNDGYNTGLWIGVIGSAIGFALIMHREANFFQEQEAEERKLTPYMVVNQKEKGNEIETGIEFKF